MSSTHETHPLLRVRKSNGEIEELTIGPSAGYALVVLATLVLIGALVACGGIARQDIAPTLKALLSMLHWRPTF